jgi:hypothetical protein
MLPESIRHHLYVWDRDGEMPDDVPTLHLVIKALRRDYENAMALVDEISEKGLHLPSNCPAGVGEVPT